MSYTRNVYRATPIGLANRLTRSGQITPTAPRSAPPAAVAAEPHTSNRTAKGRAKGATHTCARPRTRVRFRATPPRSPRPPVGYPRLPPTVVRYPLPRHSPTVATLPLTSFRERLGARAQAGGRHGRVSRLTSCDSRRECMMYDWNLYSRLRYRCATKLILLLPSLASTRKVFERIRCTDQT